MPKQNQKTPKRSNHRIIESDDESHDSEHTPRTVNKGDDTEQGSDTEEDNDDEDYDSLSAPGSLAKDIETAERDIDQYGTNLSTKNKKRPSLILILHKINLIKHWILTHLIIDLLFFKLQLLKNQLNVNNVRSKNVRNVVKKKPMPLGKRKRIRNIDTLKHNNHLIAILIHPIRHLLQVLHLLRHLTTKNMARNVRQPNPELLKNLQITIRLQY